MIRRLYPNYYVASIYDMNLEELKKEGVKGIIFDIDNTLVPYDVPEPTKEIISFFEHLKKEGFKITLASNNTEDRVLKFNEKLKVFAIHKSRKPRTINLRKAMNMMELQPKEVMIVGDQIFTDVYGGNRAKIKTMLVVPVSEKDEWITKIKRGIEKRVINRYERQRGIRKG